jgi:hypothetical protein
MKGVVYSITTNQAAISSLFRRMNRYVGNLAPMPGVFSHFVTSMTAPIASGWSGCRVGLAPTGKRRLCTAHARSGHSIADPLGSHWTLRSI